MMHITHSHAIVTHTHTHAIGRTYVKIHGCVREHHPPHT